MAAAEWAMVLCVSVFIVLSLLAISAAAVRYTPEVERELARCQELRRVMIQAGWFN